MFLQPIRQLPSSLSTLKIRGRTGGFLPAIPPNRRSSLLAFDFNSKKENLGMFCSSSRPKYSPSAMKTTASHVYEHQCCCFSWCAVVVRSLIVEAYAILLLCHSFVAMLCAVYRKGRAGVGDLLATIRRFFRARFRFVPAAAW